MGLFGEIEPVPYRLLDELEAQMDANRERLGQQQDLKGMTRPRPQRSVFNATMSSYRRPEPAAHPRGGDLDVFWVYYGGDGRYWIRSATGNGGWSLVGSYTPFDEPAWITGFTIQDTDDYVRDNKPFFESHVSWDGFKAKTWSPAYGDKGVHGDWYDFRRTRAISYAIKEETSDPIPKELHVDFKFGGGGYYTNTSDWKWTTAGRGAVSAMVHDYTYYADAEYHYVSITEQMPLIFVRYWNYQIDAKTANPPSVNEYSVRAFNGEALSLIPADSVKIGITQEASAWLQAATATWGLSAIVYDAGRWLSPAAGSCTDTSYGGNTCPFKNDPPNFTWAQYGWPNAKFDGDSTLETTYRNVNPFLINFFSQYHVPNQGDETEQAMRDAGVLTGGGPYSFDVVTAQRTNPITDPDSSLDRWAGIDGSAFIVWRSSSGASSSGLSIDYSTPHHINYLLRLESVPEDKLLEAPGWTWGPDTESGGFSVDLGNVDDSMEAAQLLMASGPLKFIRSDGKRESVIVGGADTPFPPDDEPQWSAVDILVATSWGQRGAVQRLAKQLGIRP